RRLDGPARAAARAAGAVSAHGHREAHDVRTRPAPRVLRSSGDSKSRARRVGAKLPLVIAHRRHREEPGVPDADPAPRCDQVKWYVGRVLLSRPGDWTRAESLEPRG